jgi:hypothetical protein
MLVKLSMGETEEIALRESCGFIGFGTGQRVAKKLIRTCQTKQHLITMDGDAAEFHHSPHHQPEMVP